MLKKKLSLCALALLATLSFQSSAYACTGFIIGKNLTSDGSTLYGRTEDLEPNHNKNFIVRKAKDNKADAKWKDQANGFEYPLPKHSFKYTAVPDVTPKEGVFDEAGTNEYGVSMSATVSASANDKILKVDPYIKNGLAESSMASLVLPRVKTAKEGIELIAKVVREKGSAEGNIVTLADKDGVWYMEILSGHQYAAIKFPDDKFAVFPNTFYLGHVNFNDKENTIVSTGIEKVAQKANSYKTVDGQFHIAQSYNPPLADANRSRTFSGIKSLDPDSKVTYKDDYYELLQSTSKKFTLEDAMKLQRNRFEGLDLKPLDQMELDGKGKPKSKAAIKGYAYPISNPNVMEAHIFQLKEDMPAEVGGGVMWLAMGSPRNAPYLPYLANISQTYKAYHQDSTKYNKDSWYWTVSHINDMVAANSKKFGSQVIDDIHGLEKTWMTEQDSTNKEVSDLAKTNPKAAQDKANQVSLERAEKTFKHLKEIEKRLEKESSQNKDSKTAK
ncbi:C69 family dipeptidase [Streptococcus didelphis]|uniref:C69 family dipeptidase n=1 Tax=Streptococcus didelphis TaxID=102886 RepID=UPI0003802FD4|nr:C69 family dipeptidase [Streptococcus didelphis]WMB29848.1 C69 family dipeptidase [Streptococcus didelphis]